MFGWNFLGFNLYTLSLVLLVGTIICSYQDSMHIDHILLSLFFSMLNHPYSHNLSSCERCSNPLIIFASLCWTLSITSLSLLHWRAQNWTLHSRCVSQEMSRGERSPC